MKSVIQMRGKFSVISINLSATASCTNEVANWFDCIPAMASVVNVCSVDVLENPGKFGDPFKLEITFECYEPLIDG